MKKITYIIILILIPFKVIGEEKKCSEYDKLSKMYAKCIADKSKLKVDESLEKVGFKEKMTKFKNSKTFMDLFK